MLFIQKFSRTFDYLQGWCLRVIYMQLSIGQHEAFWFNCHRWYFHDCFRGIWSQASWSLHSPDWVLPFMDYLPYYEDSKTTGSHILLMVHQLQGGASPFGCDASHCRDVMLRYSNSCACLCDFCCRIVSSSL